jgi:dTDP-3-amino-3,4,6-trideoxy-alpha-D-glucose transaminase
MQIKANRFDRAWEECGPDILHAVSVVGTSGWYILGNEVKEFERELAAYCGARHAIGCGNGMDALEMSLRGLGLKPGDKVLTTPLSAFATTLAIMRAGGVPVFCDVDEFGLLDPDLADACLQTMRDIRFIMPVHLYGHAMDLTHLRTLMLRHDVTVIEDAAQAIGAQRNGQAIGSCGRATCFSFYPTKNLGALGDGGAIITNDDALFAELSILRNYGQKERYIHTHTGMNSRLDELHAAVLRRVFLPRLPAWTKRRREIAAAYCSRISNPSVTIRPGPTPTESVWHLFPILIAPERRDTFLRWMRQAGIDADVHYPRLIPEQDALTTEVIKPIIFGQLTRAAQYSTQEVSLPINPFLTDSEIEHVIATINAWER